MGGSKGGGAMSPDPPEKSQNIGFLSNTGPDPLKNHKATKPTFNVSHHRPASEMAFRWRADDGPLLVLFGSSLPISKTKKLDPIWQNLLDPRMNLQTDRQRPFSR